MVFGVVKSANVKLQSAQLNFCKAQNIISCAKTAITYARTDTRFDSMYVEFVFDYNGGER